VSKQEQKSFQQQTILRCRKPCSLLMYCGENGANSDKSAHRACERAHQPMAQRSEVIAIDLHLAGWPFAQHPGTAGPSSGASGPWQLADAQRQRPQQQALAGAPRKWAAASPRSRQTNRRAASPARAAARSHRETVRRGCRQQTDRPRGTRSPPKERSWRCQHRERFLMHRRPCLLRTETGHQIHRARAAKTGSEPTQGRTATPAWFESCATADLTGCSMAQLTIDTASHELPYEQMSCD
jgi:hypothetical protein